MISIGRDMYWANGSVLDEHCYTLQGHAERTGVADPCQIYWKCLLMPNAKNPSPFSNFVAKCCNLIVSSISDGLFPFYVRMLRMPFNRWVGSGLEEGRSEQIGQLASLRHQRLHQNVCETSSIVRYRISCVLTA